MQLQKPLIREEQGREIESSLRWLVEQTGLAVGAPSAAANMLPKTANFLLPCLSLVCFREKVGAWLPSAAFGKALWPLFRMAYQWRSRKRIWPKTMEVDFRSQNDAWSNSPLRRGAPCMVVSMSTYLPTATKLMESFAEYGRAFDLLVPAGLSELVPSRMVAGNSVQLIEANVTPLLYQEYQEAIASATDAWPRMLHRIRREGPQLLRDLSLVCCEQLGYVTTEVVPQMMMYHRLAEAVLHQLSPKVLFVTRLKRFTENSFAAVAKEIGIPVVLVNHGHIDQRWNAFELGKVDERCDAVFAWGGQQKQAWLTLYPGLGPEKVRTIGGIQWDKQIRRFRTSGEAERSNLRTIISDLIGKTSGRRVAVEKLWVTLTVDDDIRPMLADVIGTVLRVGEVHVLVKSRPNETLGNYQYLVERFGEDISVISRETPVDLAELLFASDIALTCVSTTNLDALTVGTPVLTLLLAPELRHDSRAMAPVNAGMPGISRLGELEELLAHWSSTAQYREDLRQTAREATGRLLANYPEGDAALRIMAEIDGITPTTAHR